MAITTEGEKKFAGANELKVGSYVLVEGEPCQIKGIEKSKPGKHGAAKIRANAMGLFRDTKKTLMKPSDAEIEVPIIDKGTAQVVAVMGTTIQIMDVSTYETFDVDKP